MQSKSLQICFVFLIKTKPDAFCHFIVCLFGVCDLKSQESAIYNWRVIFYNKIK